MRVPIFVLTCTIMDYNAPAPVKRVQCPILLFIRHSPYLQIYQSSDMLLTFIVRRVNLLRRNVYLGRYVFTDLTGVGILSRHTYAHAHAHTHAHTHAHKHTRTHTRAHTHTHTHTHIHTHTHARTHARTHAH